MTIQIQLFLLYKLIIIVENCIECDQISVEYEGNGYQTSSPITIQSGTPIRHLIVQEYSSYPFVIEEEIVTNYITL